MDKKIEGLIHVLNRHKIYCISFIVIYVALWSLLVVHFFFYDANPLQSDYLFPVRPFLLTFILGFIICYFSWELFIQSNRRSVDMKLTTYLRSLLANAILTVGSFTVLYLLNNRISNITQLSEAMYFKLLFLIVLITTIQVSFLFLIRILSINSKRRDEKDMYINNGVSQLTVSQKEILGFKIHSKMIKTYLKSGKSYYTQFQSLEEVSDMLEPSSFFRINRQYLIRREAINEIKKNGDRRLVLQLNESVPGELKDQSLVVSRYKRKDFSNWYFEEAVEN